MIYNAFIVNLGIMELWSFKFSSDVWEVIFARAPRLPACLTALSLGFFSASSQIILLREVLNFGRGNELTVASALFFWLAGIGIGAWIFSCARSRRRTRLTLIILGYAGIATAFGCCAACRIFGLFTIQVGVAVSIQDLMLCCVATMLPPGVMTGALFPLIVAAGKRSLSGSLIYLLEAAGSAAGGLIFTFLLAGRADHFTILAGASLPLIVSQTLFFFTKYGNRTARAIAGIIAVSASAALIVSSGKLNEHTHALRWKSISGDLLLVSTVETRHQRLDFALEEDQYSVFSDGNFDFSFPDPYGAGRLADVVLLEHPSPQRILVIGGSPIDIVERSGAHGVKKVDYVQIDPVMIDLVRRAMPEAVDKLFCGPCVGNFVPEDGRRFLRLAQPDTYDIIWVDLSDPMTLLVNRYYTLEFYRQVRRTLRPDGLFVSGFHLDYSAPQKASKIYSASIFKTITEVFKKNIFGFYGKVIVFASDADDVLTDGSETLSVRAAGRGLDPLMYPPELFENLFNRPRSKWLGDLLAEEQAVINTDMHPVSYRLQLQYFVHLIGSGIEETRESTCEKILKKTWRITWWLALLPALAAFLPLIILRRKPAAASASLVYAMALTGAAGILLQLVLLLAYQTFSGVMYEGIGLLYAAFMIGLVAGTAFGEKLPRKKAFLSEIIVLINTVAVAMILPSAGRALFIIPFLVVTSGFATGFAFPLLYSAHRKIQESTRKEGFVKSAGIIDGADHLGAAIGALLCALILIPSFGLTRTLILIIIYKLTSLLLLVTANRA